MRNISAIVLLGALFLPVAALAQIDGQRTRPVVYVACGSRQGSGVVTNAAAGYVITAGHVVRDEDTGEISSMCRVGLVREGEGMPATFYEAAPERVVFDTGSDLDLAVLKVSGLISGPSLALVAAPVSEFARQGDLVTIMGFAGSQSISISIGQILGWRGHSMLASNIITQGFSGAAALDTAGNVVGLAVRVDLSVDPVTGVETVTRSEFVDVLALDLWLDTFGEHAHDTYVTHADPARYHAAPYVIRDETPGCNYVVRTSIDPAVYCLRSAYKRYVFPNESVFRSWYPDFSDVRSASPSDLARYALAGVMTYKPGTLIKIQTDPRAYLVTDGVGTIRWITAEERAAAFFGVGWASLVRDVSDGFFILYKEGPPL